jgi:hypothetical protein
VTQVNANRWGAGQVDYLNTISPPIYKIPGRNTGNPGTVSEEIPDAIELQGISSEISKKPICAA